jgi:hypothetical protein
MSLLDGVIFERAGELCSRGQSACFSNTAYGHARMNRFEHHSDAARSKSMF